MAQIKLGVTLHSFLVEYYTYRYTLEDCLAAVGSLGPAQGVELVGPQMVRGYPDLPVEFERRFRRAVEQYDLRPTGYGGYGDAQRIAGRWASKEEQLDYMKRQMRAAKRLGFGMIRVQPSEIVFTDLVGYAEKHDIKMVIEIHSPMAIENIEPIIQRVEAVASPYLGFAPDCGPFCNAIAEVAINHYLDLGVSQDIVDLIVERWHEQAPEDQVAEEVRELGGDRHAQQFVAESHVHWGHSNPESLHRIMPYIYHVHGKFFDVHDGGWDSAVRLPEVVDALQAGAYDGYISCEYDGHLWTTARPSIEQIRVLQDSIRKRIGKQCGSPGIALHNPSVS